MFSENFPFDVIIANEQLCSLAAEYKRTMEEERLIGLANGYEDLKWREELFVDTIVDYLPLCALSAEERDKCQQRAHSLTKRAVNQLRCYNENKKDANSGEIGEILLYGIMQYYFHADESVPKIFYKQNRNNLVTGADSIHIIVEENEFSFWLGESKLYEDLNQAMTSAVESVKAMLDRAKLNKEKSYISGINDIRNSASLSKYKDEIIAILSESESVDKFRCKLHVPILLMSEDKEVREAQELNDALKMRLKEKYIRNAVIFFEKLKSAFASDANLCKGVKFHLILFPVHDVKKLNVEFSKIKKFYS